MAKRLKNLIRFFYYLLKHNASIGEWFNLVVDSTISSKSNLLGSYHIYNSTIGDYTYIAQNAYISYTDIGKYCSIGPNLLCGWGIHPIAGISTSPMFYSTSKQNGYSVCEQNKIGEREPIVIGNDVFIGANVTILDGIIIGNGAVIGAGAVVSKNIPSYAVAVGCPIRIIKYRFDKSTIDKLEKSKWWNENDNIHSCIEKDFFDVEHFLEALDKK